MTSAWHSRSLLFGRAAVYGEFVHAGAHLLLQAADTLHEELVEIGTHDGEELDAFQQRCAVVLGLVQYAAVESQPGELAIEVPGGVREVDAGVGCGVVGFCNLGHNRAPCISFPSYTSRVTKAWPGTRIAKCRAKE